MENLQEWFIRADKKLIIVSWLKCDKKKLPNNGDYFIAHEYSMICCRFSAQLIMSLIDGNALLFWHVSHCRDNSINFKSDFLCKNKLDFLTEIFVYVFERE